jgi:hypothetical protein
MAGPSNRKRPNGSGRKSEKRAKSDEPASFWPDGDEPDAGSDADEEYMPGQAPPCFHVKAKAVLLTYNNLPDGIENSFDEFVAAFEPFLDTVARYSVCLERGERVHGHAYLEARKQFDCSLKHFTLASLGDECVPGDCKANTVKGSGYRVAADRGHNYVQCIYKNTHLHQSNNYEAGEGFLVKTQWIQTLWGQQKINDDKVLECAAYYRCLTPALEGMVRITLQKRKQKEKGEKAEVRRKLLQGETLPFKVFPQIDEWLRSFEQVTFRYKFLILHGERSQIGKTEKARSLFKTPFIHRDSVCWNGYDENIHDGIIFDDVFVIYKYISENRALFQAGSSVTVQTSPTNAYALTVDVTQKPIVVTTNDAPYGDWILANSVTVHVNEPTWWAMDVMRTVRQLPKASLRAARVVQAAWRRHGLRKLLEERTQRRAACVVQAAWRRRHPLARELAAARAQISRLERELMVARVASDDGSVAVAPCMPSSTRDRAQTFTIPGVGQLHLSARDREEEECEDPKVVRARELQKQERQRDKERKARQLDPRPPEKSKWPKFKPRV